MKLTLTISEATVLSGLSRSTFYKLFNAGVLTPRKVGNRTLILLSELEMFLSNLPTAKFGPNVESMRGSR